MDDDRVGPTAPGACRIGSQADVAWIQESTRTGLTITSAIPPVLEAHATVVVSDEEDGRYGSSP